MIYSSFLPSVARQLFALVAIFALFLTSVPVAFAGGSVTNAQVTGGDSVQCAIVGTEVTVSATVSATSPSGKQIAKYGYVIYWGDGNSYDSGLGFFTVEGESKNISHSYVYTSAATNTISVIVYHNNPQGQDHKGEASFDYVICVVEEPVNTKPVITLTGSSTVYVDLGDSYIDAGATANDAEDGNITLDIVVGGDVVDTNATGTYTITYNVVDSETLAADEVTRTVIVRVVDPVIEYGTLTVTKILNGSQHDKNDFAVFVNGTTTRLGEDPVEIQIPVGAYSATEVAWITENVSLLDYDIDRSAGCEGEMTTEGARCVITNTYNPNIERASLTIVKQVQSTVDLTNWNFAFAGDLSDFSLTNTATSTTFSSIATGTYTITEGTYANWELTNVTCDVAFATTTNGVSVTLVDGDEATCTFSNTFTEPVEARYTLRIEITGEGDGTIEDNLETLDCDYEERVCFGTYATGTEVTLTVTPNEGSTFDNSWTAGAGTCTGNTTPCAITMNGDTSMEAHFDLADTSTGGGSTPRRSSGTLIRPTPTVAGDSTSAPAPLVLGEQVSVVPVAGVAAGAGGTAPQSAPVSAVATSLVAILAGTRGLKVSK